MKIYLSCSFQKQDRKLIDYFVQLVSSHNARVLTGEDLAGEEAIASSVKERLDESDGIIALLTRRQLLVDGTWTTHRWVMDEINYARSKQKRLIVFVENGVKLNGIFIDYEQITLQRNRPVDAILALSHTIGKWGLEREQEPSIPPKIKRQDGKPTPPVFINYRRDDSDPYAGRLYDALRMAFGRDQVFRDRDSIEPGDDFAEVSLQTIKTCKLVIALIGKSWLTISVEGIRRLDKLDDLVQLELETALKVGITIIPVLLQNVHMPSERDLPNSIAMLSRRNALEISDSRWGYDVEQLIQTIISKFGLKDVREKRI